MIRFCVTLIFISIVFIELSAQNKIDVALGVGASEFYFVSGRYQLKQAQIGLNIGGMRYKKDFYGNRGARLDLGISFYKHLFGTSSLSDRKPWFIKAGLIYDIYFGTPIKTHKFYTLIYFGREFNITKKIGASIATGPVLKIYEKRIEEWYSSGPPLRNFTFTPGFELNVFYRLY